MDGAEQKVRQAINEARRNDDEATDAVAFFGEEETLESPLDRETLDEERSPQLGRSYGPPRRYED